MQPDRRILVRRYSRHDLDSQPFHSFDPDSGLIEPAAPGIAAGWLVEGERIIEGGGGVVFCEQDGVRFVGISARAFELDETVRLVHEHGALVSRLSVVDAGGVAAHLRYLTPWWRNLFDDGSHPDLNDPIRYLSDRWR